MKKYYGLLLCIMALPFLAAHTNAENDPLGDSQSTASDIHQELKETMQSDIFNVGTGGMSNSTSSGVSKMNTIVISRIIKPAIDSIKPPVEEAPIAAVAGSWHLDLTDSMQRSINISISQSGSVVYGIGSMISGNVIQEVAAFGSVVGSKLTLDLLSMTDVNLYRLNLDMNTPNASVNYTAFSASNGNWTGIATGGFKA